MKTPRSKKELETYKHVGKKRSNLPTDETGRLMPDEDKRPQKYVPPLCNKGGPALSWDRTSSIEKIEVDAHPLYIQEKIRPVAFVESICNLVESGWLDFNGLPENATYEWYKHKGEWQNRIIRGDSAHIMASLAQREGLTDSIQMIYYDPPYGISFKSNMQVNTRSRSTGNSATSIPNDPSVVKAFRDTYKNGIHSYFDNIFLNTSLARTLLASSGSIFLQIGQRNVHRIAVILEEVFGAENHVATIPFAKSGSTASSTLSSVADYILWFAKDKEQLIKKKYRHYYEPLTRVEKIKHMSWGAAWVELSDGSVRKMTAEEQIFPDKNLPPDARIVGSMPLVSQDESKTGRSEPFCWNGVTYPCPQNSHWRVSHQGLGRMADLNRLMVSGEDGILSWKKYEDEVPGRKINNLWSMPMQPNDLHYIVETSEKVIERCMLMCTDPGDLVLDITCGSGTTAYVAEKWGRRWITTDVSSVAISLTRQRLVTGIFPYHLLQDSEEGAKKEAEISGEANLISDAAYMNDLSKGFVHERVPNVSAASIAYDQTKEPILLTNRTYLKPKTIRVCSPITIESQSPHRYIPPDESEAGAFQFSVDLRRALLSALEISGIRTNSGRLVVSGIEDWPTKSGLVTHTALTETENKNAQKARAAIMIAPDDVTVPPAMINRAVGEAANISHVSQLIVIAFSYEPEVRTSEFENRGKLSILRSQANRDLQIGNLTDAASDNAFVLIGEPDVRAEAAPGMENKIIVKVVGYDTYNPSSGNVEAGGEGDIDCWMIDTEYSGEAFLARQIYFPNKSSDKQIARLRGQLRSKIDPSRWRAMLSNTSIPFTKPKSNLIAVRIVTTTHTEMSVVLDVSNV